MILAGVVEPGEQITGPVHAVVVSSTRVECLPGCWGDDPHLDEYRAIDRQGASPAPVVQLEPGQEDLIMIDGYPRCPHGRMEIDPCVFCDKSKSSTDGRVDTTQQPG